MRNSAASYRRLRRVMAKLRSPHGCPWDRKQTHESLLRYLFEEAGELRRAIRRKDIHNIEEELGDVLFQVVFHAQIAEEKGRFTLEDVIDHLVRKLTLRHPHVFGYTQEHHKLLGKKQLKTSKDVLANWNALKKISTQGKGKK